MAAALAELKWGGLATIMIALMAVSYYYGGEAARHEMDRDHAAQLTAVVQGFEYKAKVEAEQEATDDEAQRNYDQTIQTINAHLDATAPVIVYRPGALCAGTVPGTETKAGPVTAGAAAGAVQPGSGTDIRPELEALKKKYETILADYRRLDAEWPTQ